MNIETIVVGPIETNCYLVHEPKADFGLIIDPGGDAGKIIAACDEADITPRLIVNTHAHFDHIAANAMLMKHFPELQVAVGEIDAEDICDPMRNLGAGFGVDQRLPRPDRTLADGEILSIGKLDFTVLHTPGHTRGSISLINREEKPSAAFCGDLLFENGVGRTDLPGGNDKELRNSILSLLSACDDNTVLYPGHGASVTAGARRHNSFEGYL